MREIKRNLMTGRVEGEQEERVREQLWQIDVM